MGPPPNPIIHPLKPIYMANPVVRKAQDGETAAQEPVADTVTKEEALAMAQEAAEQAVAKALETFKAQQPVQAQPVQHITVSTDGGTRPQLQPRPYTTATEDVLDKPGVTYTCNQVFYTIAPIKVAGKFYDTPGSQLAHFTNSSMRAEGDNTVVESRLTVFDAAWCRAIEARPDYGRTITRKGENRVSADGIRAMAYDRWGRTLSSKSYSELNLMANDINSKASKELVPLSDNINTLRSNLVGYHVRLEIDGDNPVAGRPATPEAVIEALATR